MPAHIASNMNGDTPAEPSSLASAHTMMELLRSADAVVVSDHARARQLIDCVMDILRATLDEHADAPSASAGRLAPWQERRLKTHIEANLSVSLTTAELAGVVNLSPSYFSRAFKKSFGQPPHSYLTTRRTIRAQELMLTTNEPLSQIAVACGLVDQSALCRLFRRTVGRNPHAWRRAFKGARCSGVLQSSLLHSRP
ncbi:AraC family transcriptional regulator [Bradyrhizobium sp. CIAT3101]|uniref:helix-turn-helix domain-containing protein n=1 Tax=Bradyrhizobium sp. CIAT3101 TaxID=439387 RepID=UPI0024B26571|nr:AraC family transcriptional regulator [Bradyrhizobium sp. CIAT3101]WFU84418.1 AraC family transcriptional regulator [Bradyrhizobium sp. CIAT3101]